MGRAEDLTARISSRGEAAIDELILERQSEELFLDFKRADGTAPAKETVPSKPAERRLGKEQRP